jgi:hypothetical protein
MNGPLNPAFDASFAHALRLSILLLWLSDARARGSRDGFIRTAPYACIKLYSKSGRFHKKIAVFLPEFGSNIRSVH